MEDIQMIEAVERYIRGEMKPDERVHFEHLRKINPEIDQLVVEHTLFLHQVNELADTKALKSTLNDVHVDLAERGLIKSARLKGKAKVVYLWNRYKRVAAIAASIAGITTLTISFLVWSLSPKTNPQDVKDLERSLSEVKAEQRNQKAEVNEMKKQITPNNQIKEPVIHYNTGGSGFLVDGKGYIVTNAHVVRNAKNVAVQNRKGETFNAQIVFTDAQKDLAVLKITDDDYKSPGTVPYSILNSNVNLAEPIFTLGYPRNDVVYGQGYLSSRTGHLGDTLSFQITIAANPGNSGGPILNHNGDVIGILSRVQTSAEGVVFGVHGKYINNMISELKKKDTAFERIKLTTNSSLKGLDRERMVQKIEDYVFMVKVNR